MKIIKRHKLPVIRQINTGDVSGRCQLPESRLVTCTHRATKALDGGGCVSWAAVGGGIGRGELCRSWERVQ